MAGKQVAGDALPANLAGMSKNQLYDIMSQMKALIEQNQQQARQILIQNPLLTKALFQAQIMLGMVKPPQEIPKIQLPSVPQHPQSSVQPTSQSNISTAQSLSGQVGLEEQTSGPQTQSQMRTQHHSQPATPVSSMSVPPTNLVSQPFPSQPLQTPQQSRGHPHIPVAQMSLPQSSQLPSMPAVLHPGTKPALLSESQMPAAPNLLQQPLQTAGISHLPLQPPLPPQPRPPVPTFHHQYAPQMGPNVGFQQPGVSQHSSQPMFHSGIKPPPVMGPSFPHGQPALSLQQPPQSLYQGGGSHLMTEFGNQVGNSVPGDRGSSWMFGPSASPTITPLQAPSTLGPVQMGPSNQAARPPPLTPEMEKALLQQVMSLTPEQINLLPPEQRNQVLQLQQILRQ